MRTAWLALLLCHAAAGTDWLEEVQRHRAALESEHRWQEALDVYRAALGRLDPSGSPRDRFWLLAGIAEAAFELEDYVQARQWLKKAEEASRSLGPEAPEQARLLNARGTLYLVEGNLTAAERDLLRAAAIFESKGGPADRAAALHNLASIEMQTGRLTGAEIHQTEALTLWRAVFGDRHHYVMKAWIGLSSVQGLRGDWQAAKRSVEQALTISETAEALANYAVVLEKLKRGGEAKAIRQRLGKLIPARAHLVDAKALRSGNGKTQVRAR